MNDILNSKGNKLNWINNNPYSEEYKIVGKNWNQLPLYTNTETIKKIFKLIDTKQVILLQSATGSGKSVLIPKFLLKYFIDNKIEGKICMTNPKIITTEENAKYGARTLDVVLGEEVGYKYKGSSKISDKTKLIYLTDGLLLSTISSGDKYLDDYSGVIIDEAHERNIQIDLLLKLLKEIVLHRPKFKLIIMSATINAEVFNKYFNIKGIKYGEIEVSGSTTFPIQKIWSDTNINNNNYLKIAIEKCNEILKKNENKDIIIFVPTQNDTINGCQLITENNKQLYCAELHSKTKTENKELAISKDLYKKSGYNVKVIFATNVAESSITVDGLYYVIDTGLELVSNFDSKFNMNVVKKDFTTQSQIIQRIGRTGRTSAGIGYHLYTKEKFDSLEKYPKPNILVMDITEYALSLINYTKTLNSFINFTNDLITKPSKDQIDHIKHKLKFTKCLKMKKQNGVLSRIGINILKFRSTSVLAALAIIMSYYLDCQLEIIIIMAMIEITDGKIDTLFVYDNEKKLKQYFSQYSYLNSDHLTILNIYQDLYKNDKKKYLNHEIFRKIDKQIKDYKHYAKSIREKNLKYINKKYNLVPIEPYDNKINNILYILGRSHQYNLIKNNSTVNFINNSKALIEFSKVTNNDKNNYENTICHSLINRFNRILFNCVTKIPNFIKFLDK
jgi:pre-mRNA-splicing factor ATP-dependent RNA helicase DHX15/PRP43